MEHDTSPQRAEGFVFGATPARTASVRRRVAPSGTPTAPVGGIQVGPTTRIRSGRRAAGSSGPVAEPARADGVVRRSVDATIRRVFEWDDRRGTYVWRPPPDRPTMADIEALPPGAPFTADMERRSGGGRGWWGPAGVHHSVSTDGETSGQQGPAAYPDRQNVTTDYGSVQVHHHGVPVRPPAAAGQPPGPSPAAPPFAPLDHGAHSFFLTGADLAAGAATDRTQMRSAMGGVSADQAAQAAGQQPYDGGAHWMHLRAHSHHGEERPENAVAGAGGANQRHRVLEHAAAEAVPRWGPMPITAVPQLGDPAWHTASALDYRVGAAADPSLPPRDYRLDLTDGTMPRPQDQAVLGADLDRYQMWAALHAACDGDPDEMLRTIGDTPQNRELLAAYLRQIGW